MHRMVLAVRASSIVAVLLVTLLVPTPSHAQSQGRGYPEIYSVQGTLTNDTQEIVIRGRNFGFLPAYDGSSPYILITNWTQDWNAGCRDRGDEFPTRCVNDAITLRITSWRQDADGNNAEIRIEAFTGLFGAPYGVADGDEFTVYVWNALSGAGPATRDISITLR